MKLKTKLVESSLGVKTTEDMARRIDEALKDLPSADRQVRRKSSTTGAEVEAGKRTATGYVSTTALDRDFEIVLPDAFELDDYRRNPIVLYSHDPEKPVGKALWIKPTESGLVAKTHFPPRPSGYQGEWLPDLVFGLMSAGVLKGFSVGYLPLEMRGPTPEELAEFPDVQQVVSRALLMEYSVVSIPCNPLALVETIEKGIGLDLFNFKKVGHVRKKTPPKPKVFGPMAEAMKDVKLDVDKIAEQVVRNILSRWEA